MQLNQVFFFFKKKEKPMHLTGVRIIRFLKFLIGQAVRQFGTDFAMIQQLFPGKTRHQVKLKYKAEERKHPLQVADALIHRSKGTTSSSSSSPFIYVCIYLRSLASPHS